MEDTELVDRHALISRDEAHAQALVYFFTGRPCKRGHIDLRFVSSGGCKSCVNRTSGRVARGTNVVSVLHVFATSPTPEERIEVQKVLASWSDAALLAVRKVLADRIAASKALDTELRAKAAT